MPKGDQSGCGGGWIGILAGYSRGGEWGEEAVVVTGDGCVRN